MKKIMSMMLGIMMTVSLCACSKKELPDGITTAGEAHTETGAEDRPQVPHLSIDKDEGENDLSETVGTLISDQTFDVELGQWGKVTFASFAPDIDSFAADGQNADVRFYLMDQGKVLYEFPGWNGEHTSSDLFLAVSAVAFQDYNGDGLLDVITLCEYESMSGEGFQTARIYFQMEDKKGFEEDMQLSEYLSKQHKTDSIASILAAKEDYWDYFASMNGQQGMYDQLTVMAENRKMWLKDLEFAGEVYRYAVADLDRNGRLELMVSDMGGTGIYTYSRFYEINESYDGLEECVTDFREGDSQPDIISETLKTYVDNQGAFYYAVYDLLRNGVSEYYENVRSLTLQDGTIVTAPIAYRTTIFKEDVPVISCTDGEGKEITEEEYEHAAETYFAGYQVRETKLGWQDMRELEGDTAEIAAQLDASLNVFLYSE